ncbi:hypothetical protein TD95_004747 [Thielaviopsis punctulata]|uniref:AMMECR1 domain-containing protein n=1 Tax=Thielaviopsis punctulata TaxID=72032 RepID=A0A0F4ZD48_9PEZI|nr:hypothetical protein TD95_004747 [Thielaviopsis punctulata]
MASVVHCIFCFDVLAARLSNRSPVSLSTIQSSWPSFLSATGSASAAAEPLPASASYPLFVTWNTLTDGSTDLRGCIGTFSAQPLATGLASYAVTAALRDSRFTPVRLAELPDLQAAVTLLTDFEPCKNKFDWTVGEHGIIVKFRYRGEGLSATFLPDVMVEQGWDKEETLKHLMRKAGWRGNLREWDTVELEVERYKGSKAKASYKEWKKWHEWYTAEGNV